MLVASNSDVVAAITVTACGFDVCAAPRAKEIPIQVVVVGIGKMKWL